MESFSMEYLDYAPFLKQQWFLPGTVKQLKTKPKNWDYQHAITHHKIFVQVQLAPTTKKNKTYKWVAKNNNELSGY